MSYQCWITSYISCAPLNVHQYYIIYVGRLHTCCHLSGNKWSCSSSSSDDVWFSVYSVVADIPAWSFSVLWRPLFSLFCMRNVNQPIKDPIRFINRSKIYGDLLLFKEQKCVFWKKTFNRYRNCSQQQQIIKCAVSFDMGSDFAWRVTTKSTNPCSALGLCCLMDL